MRGAIFGCLCGWGVIAGGCAVEPMYVNQGVSARGGSSATQSGGATATMSTGGSVYTACTGKLEEIQSGGKALCVARMARIGGPTSSSAAGGPSGPTAGAPSGPTAGAPSTPNDYTIDVTEVTRGQYEAWVATNPELPASDDANCAWKRDPKEKKYSADPKCMSSSTWPVCKSSCELHPQVCVDWCDAYAYCAAVNKRLCGRIGGGSNAFADLANKDESQWFRACTSAGANVFPYSGSYDCNKCLGTSNTITFKTTVEVGSLAECVTATGVYDLSGNVREWEDCCDGNGGCRMRGGSFGGDEDQLRCSAGPYEGGTSSPLGGMSSNRAFVAPYVGFRCCSR